MPSSRPKVDEQLAKRLEGLNFCFVLADCREPDCPITYASPAFYELTGYPAEETIGRNCRFLQGPETSRQKVMEMRDAIREERSSAICLVNYKRSGDKFWNQFYLAPVRDEDNCVSHYIGIQSDVSALMNQSEMSDTTESELEDIDTDLASAHQRCFPDVVQVEQQEAADLSGLIRRHSSQRQSSVRRSISLGAATGSGLPSSLLAPLMRLQQSFVLADPKQPDCPIVHASTAFLLMTGYHRDQVLGRNCRFLQGPQTDQAEVQRMRDAMSADPPQAVTVKLLNYKINGQPFWNALHMAPIRSSDGQVMFFVGVQLDITAPPTPKAAAQQTSQPHLPQNGCTDIPVDPKAGYTQQLEELKAPEAVPLQSPAAAEQAQLGLAQLSSQPAAAAAIKIECRAEQVPSPREGHRQLLQRQSAPAGSTMAAAADRAALLPDVSHLHINTHASHPVNGFGELPECGEMTARHRVDQKGVVGAVRVACRSLCSRGLRRSLEDQCVPGSLRMTRTVPAGSTGRSSMQIPRHTI